MTVFLYPNPMKDADLSVTRSAAALLRGYGAEVLMAQEFSAAMGQDAVCCPQAEGIAAADLVITVGGDGTLLRTAAECLDAGKPVLGINLGRTGFLATCEVAQMPANFRRLVDGDYHLQKRALLRAESSGGWQAFALNDVVLYSRSRLHPMDYAVYCDGICVGKFRSDGVILATPTGSTAYSLSAGGPILDVTAPVFVLTAICPHGGPAAPLVFSDKRHMTIVSSAANRDTVLAGADSRISCTLAPGDSIEIFTAEQALSYVVFDEAEQFRAVETKLTRR